MNKHLIALAALAFLTACGGGDKSQAPASTPAAALKVLRAKALAAAGDSSVSAEEAARQLMDFGEATFPEYFPTHQLTQSFPPFLFRYYPQTGAYLGVVVTPDGTYQLNGVYVKGGPFGDLPLFAGPLTKFITPVAVPPGSTGANNGCFDLAMAETTGTHLVINYALSGATTGTGSVDLLVNGLVSFEGNSAYESLSSISTSLAGQTTNVLDVKTYARRTGDAEQTQYGSTTTSVGTFGGVAANVVTKSVYTPPLVDRIAGIPLGQSITQSSTSINTTTTTVPGFPPFTSSQSVADNTTIKFVTVEPISVPAGNYQTCRFEYVHGATPTAMTTQWVIRGRGIPVKVLNTTNGVLDTSQEATSVTLNGSKL